MKVWILIYVLGIHKAGSVGQIEFNTLKECQDAATIIAKNLTGGPKKDFSKISWRGDFLCLEKNK